MVIALIIVVLLSLWSITITLEKLTDKVLRGQEQQKLLLEEMKTNLEKWTNDNDTD